MKALYTTTFNDQSKSFRWLIGYTAGLKRSIKGDRLTALTQRMMGCSNGMWTEAKTQALWTYLTSSEGEVCPKQIHNKEINIKKTIKVNDPKGH